MGFAWAETEALMHATARVDAADGAGGWEWAGTAFFVADTLLLTCAHVAVGDLRVVWHDRYELPVRIVSRHPDVEAIDPFPSPDVALLEVIGDVPPHPIAWLDDAQPGIELWAFGYTDEYIRGVARGHPARLTRTGHNPGENVWVLASDRVRGGMSGAPVLDLQTGRVVGILKRTRDAEQALGGFATGIDAVFAALPALRVVESPQARAQAVAEALWGDLLDQAAEVLAGSPAARRAVAEELALPETAEPLEVARGLFVADLDVVVSCTIRLLNLLGPEPARRVFEIVAVCASYDGEPWIGPAAAAELEQQVELVAAGQPAAGRVLRLPSRLSALNELYRRRADRRRRWRPPLAMTIFSHVTGTDGLPEDFEVGLRMATATKAGARHLAAKELDARAAAQWEALRPRALAVLQKQRVVGLLALERIDAQLVDALVTRYPLVFLLATPGDVAEDVAARAGYHDLAPGLDDDRAELALMAYDSMMEDLG